MSLKSISEDIGEFIVNSAHRNIEQITSEFSKEIEPYVYCILFLELSIAYIFIADKLVSEKIDYIKRNEVMNRAIN